MYLGDNEKLIIESLIKFIDVEPDDNGIKEIIISQYKNYRITLFSYSQRNGTVTLRRYEKCKDDGIEYCQDIVTLCHGWKKAPLRSADIIITAYELLIAE